MRWSLVRGDYMNSFLNQRQVRGCVALVGDRTISSLKRACTVGRRPDGEVACFVDTPIRRSAQCVYQSPAAAVAVAASRGSSCRAGHVTRSHGLVPTRRAGTLHGGRGRRGRGPRRCRRVVSYDDDASNTRRGGASMPRRRRSIRISNVNRSRPSTQ